MHTFNLTEVRKNLGDDEYERVTISVFKDGKGNKQWHPIVEYISFMSMVCGFDKITKDNAESVWARIVAFESVGNTKSLVFANHKPDGCTDKITIDDVRLLVGYRSNARAMTDSKWHKWLLSLLLGSVEKEMATRNALSKAGDTLYATYDKSVRSAAGVTNQEIVNRG